MAGLQSASWSFTVGRPWGVPIRLHFFFLILVVLTLAITVRDNMFQMGLMMLGVLFVSLLLHELAHAVVAIRLGGKVDQIVVGPFGGLVSPRVPDEPEIQVFVAIVGPLVHLTLLVLSAFVLTLVAGEKVLGLLHPSVPTGLNTESPWIMTAQLAFWLNWMLLLLNLLPAYPFDGGPALRAVLWPLLGRRTAYIVTSRVAMVIAAGLCVLPFVLKNPEPHATLPLWVPMITLAIFLFFSAQQDVAAVQAGRLSDDLPGYNVQADGVDLLEELWTDEEDEDDAVLVQQRYDLRRQRREQARQAEEEYEDAKVDDILARLHTSSLDDLTGEERALLQRASERYRRKKDPDKKS